MYKMYLIYFFLEDHSTIFPKLFLKVFIRDNKKTPQNAVQQQVGKVVYN